jgi:transcriptional regulator with XRE-family HTH domain
MVTPAEPQIADRIDRIRAELDIPLTRLADETGIPRTTLQRLVKNGDDCSVHQLRLVSNALGVPFLSWFEVAA